VNAGTVSIATSGGGGGPSSLGLLNITPSGTVDLNDNDLIISSGNVSDFASLIARARHDGAWDQTGLTSSVARAQPSHATGLGLLTGAEYLSITGSSTFDGVAVAGSDLLVKYTYNGDTNFSGVIDFDDYVRTDVGFNTGLSGWSNGDFNYSGVVDFDDYVLIDIAFNTQSGTLGRAVDYLSGDDRSTSGLDDPEVAMVLAHRDHFGVAYAAYFLAAVPEPATPGLVGVVAGALGRRRRRRRRLG
jgi:hypothetical protein